MTEGQAMKKLMISLLTLLLIHTSFTLNGHYLASASDDGTIKTWDTRDWKEIPTDMKHKDSARSVAFSPNGDYLASASYKIIKIWDTKKWKEIKTDMKNKNWVNSVAFSPNGDYLASASWNETIKIWETEK